MTSSRVSWIPTPAWVSRLSVPGGNRTVFTDPFGRSDPAKAIISATMSASCWSFWKSKVSAARKAAMEGMLPSCRNPKPERASGCVKSSPTFSCMFRSCEIFMFTFVEPSAETRPWCASPWEPSGNGT